MGNPAADQHPDIAVGEGHALLTGGHPVPPERPELHLRRPRQIGMPVTVEIAYDDTREAVHEGARQQGPAREPARAAPQHGDTALAGDPALGPPLPRRRNDEIGVAVPVQITGDQMRAERVPASGTPGTPAVACVNTLLVARFSPCAEPYTTAT